MEQIVGEYMNQPQYRMQGDAWVTDRTDLIHSFNIRRQTTTPIILASPSKLGSFGHFLTLDLT